MSLIGVSTEALRRRVSSLWIASARLVLACAVMASSRLAKSAVAKVARMGEGDGEAEETSSSSSAVKGCWRRHRASGRNASSHDDYVSSYDLPVLGFCRLRTIMPQRALRHENKTSYRASDG